MKKRNISLDIARGIGIILIVLAHTYSNTSIMDTIRLFIMPLFFFLSGMSMFYSLKKDISFKDYVHKQAKSILTPYFIFSFLFFIYWALIERNLRNQTDISIFENFVNIFLARADINLYSSNVVMWYLPCLFVSDILFYFLIKMNRYKGSIVSCVSLLIGYVLSINDIILPFSLEIALIAVFFIYFGYKYLEKTEKPDSLLNKPLIIVITSVISIGCMVICRLADNGIDMLNHKYGNLLLFILGAFSGIFLMLLISKLLASANSPKNIINRVFCYFGVNSLVVMLMHEPIKRIVIELLSIIIKRIGIHSMLRESFLFSLTVVLIVIIIIVPIINIINKYFPYVIGRKCNKNTSLKQKV